MKYTLRKAHRLLKTLEQHTKVQYQSKSVHASLDEERVRSTVKEVHDLNAKKIEVALQLNEDIYAIRAAIQEKNSVLVDNVSVDTLLNEKAFIENKLRILNSVAQNEANTSLEEQYEVAVQRVLDARTVNHAYGDKNVAIQGYSSDLQNELNAQLFNLKQSLETVNDQLGYLNNFLTIELSDAMVNLHKELKIA